MKNQSKLILVATMLLIGTLGFAQDGLTDAHTVNLAVPEVALVDIESAGSTTLSLGPTHNGEAGTAVDFSGATDNSLWLNYSSIKSTADATRNIGVAITAGTVPTGMTLQVLAAADAANGSGGTLGTASAALTLSGSSQNIITAIGSAYTGDGATAGHQLTYTLSLTNAAGYADLDSDADVALTVTYTITDN